MAILTKWASDVCFHLSHHLASVGFHRRFVDAKLGPHLLVQQSGDHKCHDLALAGRLAFQWRDD